LNKEEPVDKKFVLIDKEDMIEGFKADAVIGLGVDGLFPSFAEELYQQKRINSPRFAIFMNEKESRLLLGDYSQTPILSNTFKQMSYCNLGNAKEWKCDITSVKVNNKNIVFESFAKFDTSLPYLKIPISDYKIFKKYILEPTNQECILTESNQLTCKCDKPSRFSDFSLFINNSPLMINTEKIINYFPNLDYQCHFEVYIDADNYDTWVLGTNVLEDVLLSFDTANKKIGFAQNPSGIRTLLLKEEIYEDIRDDSPSDKLFWLFGMIFVMLCMYGLVRFANGDRFKFFDRTDSFDIKNKDDKLKMELIQHKFNSDEYDYDKDFKAEVHQQQMEVKK
jgi:hypothetical protein